MTQYAATSTDQFHWPAIESEQHHWVRSGDEIASRRARLRARGNHAAAVPPLIEHETPSLSSAVQAAADDASAELARFDAEAGQMVAPFASILLRSESASSSEVENLTASAKQVALAEIGASDSGNAQLVVANVQAMNAALSLADQVSVDAIIHMQQTLLEESAPQFVGSFRTEQVWIGGGRLSPHDATFVPPHHERVAELMNDLVAFMNRTDIPVLVHAAIAHAQFETIHPFADGNGRTGRALVHSMLRRGGLTRNVALPVSAGLLRNTTDYFDALTAYRNGSIAEIVSVFTEAVFAAIDNSRLLATELQSIESNWQSIVVRSNSAAQQLKTLLFAQPVVTAKIVSNELGVSEVAAQNAINTLAQAGALHRTNNSARNRVWHAPEILEALDRFGARARRKRAG